MDEKTTALVAELRSQGLPPKAIARRLGLRPAEVSAVIQEHAAQLEASADPTVLPAIRACYLSPGFSTGLGFQGAAEAWPAYDPGYSGSEGLVCALWVRANRYDRLVACGALVDVYCLGVKNAMGPKNLEAHELRSFVSRYFGSYEEPPIEVPFDLLQSLVLGAVDYADSLGFEPHPDFTAVRPSLQTLSSPSPIRFGKEGRPLYVQGPDDDVFRIVHTLRRTLGDGGFDFVAGMSSSPLGAELNTESAESEQVCSGTVEPYDAMGHEIHFLKRLLEVDPSHVDTAMMLYKDPALLRAMLGYLELPDGAERVALSLADPERGPFIVVKRNGHFVTCLREGMTTEDLPIVPRGRLDAIVAKVESLRERWQAALALTGGKDVSGQLIRRLATAGQGLSREEFTAISAMQPLLIGDIFDALGRTLDTLEAFRRRVRRPGFMKHLGPKALSDYWNQRCLVGHMTVLFAMDCQDLLKKAALDPELLFKRFILGLMGQKLLGLSVLAAWAAGKFGKYILPALKQFHTKPPVPLLNWYTGPALLAVSARSTSYRGEIAKLFERLPDVDEDARDAVMTIAELQRAVFSNVILQGDPEGWFAEAGGAEYLSLVAHLPADSALRYEAARSVPEELLAPAVATSERQLDTGERMKTMVIASARIARLEASDLYFPEAVLSQLIAPVKTEDARRVLLSDSAMSPVPEPMRAEPCPGRNEPCHCGSGKKFKRCCGLS